MIKTPSKTWCSRLSFLRTNISSILFFFIYTNHLNVITFYILYLLELNCIYLALWVYRVKKKTIKQKKPKKEKEKKKRDLQPLFV